MGFDLGEDTYGSEGKTEEEREAIQKMIDNVRAAWINLHFEKVPNYFKCSRCGQSEDVPHNKSLDWWLNFSRAFKMTHWNCMEEKDK